jgi:hypothetical protein
MSRILTLALVLCACLLAGCGAKPASNANTTPNTNASNATANSAATPAAPPADNKTANFDPATSPTNAYKAAYYARKICDIPEIKKLFDKDVLDFLTQVGQIDGKSLDDMIKDMCEQPQADTDESRNEKIDGDKATIEYRTVAGGW